MSMAKLRSPLVAKKSALLTDPWVIGGREGWVGGLELEHGEGDGGLWAGATMRSNARRAS